MGLLRYFGFVRCATGAGIRNERKSMMDKNIKRLSVAR